MEDLNDLIFDSDTGLYTDDCFDVDEDISFGYIEPMSKFNDLEVFISQDKESAKENETNVQ